MIKLDLTYCLYLCSLAFALITASCSLSHDSEHPPISIEQEIAPNTTESIDSESAKGSINSHDQEYFPDAGFFISGSNLKEARRDETNY